MFTENMWIYYPTLLWKFHGFWIFLFYLSLIICDVINQLSKTEVRKISLVNEPIEWTLYSFLIICQLYSKTDPTPIPLSLLWTVVRRVWMLWALISRFSTENLITFTKRSHSVEETWNFHGKVGNVFYKNRFPSVTRDQNNKCRKVLLGWPSYVALGIFHYLIITNPSIRQINNNSRKSITQVWYFNISVLSQKHLAVMLYIKYERQRKYWIARFFSSTKTKYELKIKCWYCLIVLFGCI